MNYEDEYYEDEDYEDEDYEDYKDEDCFDWEVWVGECIDAKRKLIASAEELKNLIDNSNLCDEKLVNAYEGGEISPDDVVTAYVLNWVAESCASLVRELSSIYMSDYEYADDVDEGIFRQIHTDAFDIVEEIDYDCRDRIWDILKENNHADITEAYHTLQSCVNRFYSKLMEVDEDNEYDWEWVV